MNVSQVRAGQVGPYCDSVYEYHVESDLEESKILDFCLTEIHRCNRDNFATADQCCGHSGFPYGLHSFYNFRKVGKGKYRYTVVNPYTD